ncbi:MAG: sigma-70 family RNA polymerase sigma factor [Candidatus Omnitrophica bacterium]|nr:sigma-70 family RNA polymerase sigma factor [Candidatus Omnitrophota bacterium]MCM8803298.1 sigma-70 family RNA polymerase sigma factor [Candidatus Omnitrophota bacterium]
MNELELVEKAKSGDNKAFEELVKRTQNKIYNLGLKILGNKDDAADLLQETYIKAYESLPNFEGKSSFYTWLYRIATNFALMKLRKEKYKKISINEIKQASNGNYKLEISDWSNNPQIQYRNEELKEILNEAINSLPPKYKTIFILHDIEGLSLSEISEILSLSIPTIKTRIHRSRLYLREKLSEYFKKKGN